MAKKKSKKCKTFKDYLRGDCSHRGFRGPWGAVWVGGGHHHHYNDSGSNGGAEGGNGSSGGNGGNGSSGNGGSVGDGGGGGMGESYMPQVTQRVRIPGQFSAMRRGLNWIHDNEGHETTDYEEDEEDSKKNQARSMYRALKNQGIPRKEIIAQFQQRIGLTDSSAVAYYERIAKEFGETEQQGAPAGMPGAGMPGAGGMSPGNMAQYGQDMYDRYGGQEGGLEDELKYQKGEKEEWEDDNRQGVIRRVKNAHLVYKRQQDDGSFSELWVYKQGDRGADELDTRRDVLAGTDIPPQKTRSPDGRQQAEVWSSGNVQFLEITGLPN